MRVRNFRGTTWIVLVTMMLALGLAYFPVSAGAEMGKPMTANDMVAAANLVVTTVSLADAKALVGDRAVLFLDVREPAEFGKGHIPGAVNVPRGVLEFNIGKEAPDKAARMVIYCKVGGRGALAAETLGKMGYTAVVNMKGGWDGWVAAGYPAE